MPIVACYDTVGTDWGGKNYILNLRPHGKHVNDKGFKLNFGKLKRCPFTMLTNAQ